MFFVFWVVFLVRDLRHLQVATLRVPLRPYSTLFDFVRPCASLCVLSVLLCLSAGLDSSGLFFSEVALEGIQLLGKELAAIHLTIRYNQVDRVL